MQKIIISYFVSSTVMLETRNSIVIIVAVPIVVALVIIFLVAVTVYAIYYVHVKCTTRRRAKKRYVDSQL